MNNDQILKTEDDKKSKLAKGERWPDYMPAHLRGERREDEPVVIVKPATPPQADITPPLPIPVG